VITTHPPKIFKIRSHTPTLHTLEVYVLLLLLGLFKLYVLFKVPECGWLAGRAKYSTW